MGADESAERSPDRSRFSKTLPGLMKRFSLALRACWFGLLLSAGAADGDLELLPSGTELQVRIRGDEDEDWRIQASGNLVDWTNLDSFGVLLSGGTNAPVRSLGELTGDHLFYRTVKAEGLYDPSLIRTFHLTFTQSNWQTLLTSGRTTGSNTVATLVLDNGATNTGVGARYKGNTSFSMGGTKKSVNLEVNFTNDTSELLGYETVNLNNAAGDETIMREAVYFNVMSRYTVSPRGALARLFINGQNWGVYSLAQQGDSDLVKEWFSSADGDRWRAPNAGGGTGGGPGGGGPGGGGMFASSLSALSWLGTSNVATYKSNYELKHTSDETSAWLRLVHACDVLNNTALSELRNKVEEVLAVDRWLWFLAIENIFADDDSYFNKGADYAFYWEPESGRIHPIEHDGNESFTAGDVSLSPVQGVTGTNRPVISRLLAVPELRQRYLAHMRTVLEESYHPAKLTLVIDAMSALSLAAITADPKKSFTMTAYQADLKALKTFVTNRYNFLTNHAELKPLAPTIVSVAEPVPPAAGAGTVITATVQAAAGEGISSVWLWYRGGPTGRFTATEMKDDGVSGDGAAQDGVYGGTTGGFVAGTKVRFYVEARSNNAAQAARFLPAQAEHVCFTYRVTTSAGTESPVVINEFLADNATALADPQGDYDDWIELRNLSAEAVDLSGMYLSDSVDNPRKWSFPAGTKIAANGYLIVWADENGSDTPGLHANFKLAAGGEQILLVDTDARLNSLLDSVEYVQQSADVSAGRTAADPAVWSFQVPTPGAANP